MPTNIATAREDEPPLTRAEELAGKTSQLVLAFLCITPAALFPIGLAYKVYTHFFP